MSSKSFRFFSLIFRRIISCRDFCDSCARAARPRGGPRPAAGTAVAPGAGAPAEAPVTLWKQDRNQEKKTLFFS